MKAITVLFLILSVGLSQTLLAQKDSVSVISEIGLRGRWQAGNLNQIGLNPYGSLVVTNKHHRSDWKASYQYLNVEGFTIISDLWLQGFHAFNPTKKIHPILTAFTGFAKSYKISHSLVTGAGLEINLRQKTPMNAIRAHVFAGYMNVAFEQESPHAAPVIGTGLRSALPLGQRVQLLWDLDSYHSLKEAQFWGANNRIILVYPLFKGLSLNVSHTTIFNNKTIAELKKTNTLMLFGIQFNFLNN